MGSDKISEVDKVCRDEESKGKLCLALKGLRNERKGAHTVPLRFAHPFTVTYRLVYRDFVIIFILEARQTIRFPLHLSPFYPLPFSFFLSLSFAYKAPARGKEK